MNIIFLNHHWFLDNDLYIPFDIFYIIPLFQPSLYHHTTEQHIQMAFFFLICTHILQSWYSHPCLLYKAKERRICKAFLLYECTRVLYKYHQILQNNTSKGSFIIHGLGGGAADDANPYDSRELPYFAKDFLRVPLFYPRIQKISMVWNFSPPPRTRLKFFASPFATRSKFFAPLFT